VQNITTVMMLIHAIHDHLQNVSSSPSLIIDHHHQQQQHYYHCIVADNDMCKAGMNGNVTSSPGGAESKSESPESGF